MVTGSVVSLDMDDLLRDTLRQHIWLLARPQLVTAANAGTAHEIADNAVMPAEIGPDRLERGAVQIELDGLRALFRGHMAAASGEDMGLGAGHNG